jgi:hypothetical protein
MTKHAYLWDVQPTVITQVWNESSRNEYVGSALGEYQVFWDVVSVAIFDYSNHPDCLAPDLKEFQTIAINNFLWWELVFRTNSATSPSIPAAFFSIPRDLYTFPFFRISWGINGIIYVKDLDEN